MRASVWNPWLNLSSWIKADVSQPSSRFRIDGIGYDTDNYNNNNIIVKERLYQTIGSYRKDHSHEAWWGIHDFASEEWEDLEVEPSQGDKEPFLLTKSGVSLNGNLYWVAFYDENDPLYHLLNFIFVSKRFSDLLCYLPCGMNHPRDALVLRVFRGDRFSLLKQCHMTKKIEILVTKNKINIEDGDDVIFSGKEDNYGGVVVNLIETEPMTAQEFESKLDVSLTAWKVQGMRGIWIKLSSQLSSLVDSAIKSHLALFLPINASHRIGIGAFVLNKSREVLVVQEIGGRFKGTGVWKLPTGIIQEWMPIEEYVNQPINQTKEMFRFMSNICLKRSQEKENYAGFSTVLTKNSAGKESYLYCSVDHCRPPQRKV
ncbi:hypothetical protein Bca52824_040770 [Brassica carinata]|uniref:Nudix hydrolase n=1 Tax=Brassica carinata TaxID=52824 RepID=A0A8X7RTS1_BRACI|nr:hypothetical protein Bca52824_040770 [Brassica carinata]